jgi:nucleoside-diphosphate-sugar epimerase
VLPELPRDWDKYAIYNESHDFPAFLRDIGVQRVEPIRCDLGSVESVKQFASDYGSEFDACLYLAANGDPALSTTEPARDLRDNALTLVSFLCAVRVKRFLYFSSGAVYDRQSGPVSPSISAEPVLPYAISKLAAERYVKFFAEHGSVGQYLIVRFFGAYGPHEPKRKIYTRLVEAFALRGEKSFRVRGDGKNLIDAMFVSDTATAIIRMLRSDHWNMTVDLCTGRPLSIDDLVSTAAKTFGVCGATIDHVGTVPEYIRFWASPNEMANAFDFRPRVSLDEGFQRLAEHLAQST